MSEQRLIDANAMVADESEAYMKAQTSGAISPITQEINSVVHRKIQMLIFDTPTIDPETLPIVRELREKLERVTGELDSYKMFFENITKCGDCNDCGKSATCEFVPKVGQTTRYNCPLWTGR